MARIPAGIQLGRGVRPGFLRTLEVLIAGGLVAGLWGGATLWKTRADLTAARLAGSTAFAEPGAPTGQPALEPAMARQAAALLFAGVLDAPDISTALDTVRGTAPPGIRIAGVEIRPTAGPGRVEAVIAADAVSAADVAGFLSALGDHDAVLSTEVISETRQTDGAVLVRITAQLAMERR